MRIYLFALHTLGCAAEIPYAQLSPPYQGEPGAIGKRAEFIFKAMRHG